MTSDDLAVLTSEQVGFFEVALTDLERYAEALIEIAARFYGQAGHMTCEWCGNRAHRDCEPDCPGLLARRALGVA